MIMGNDGAGTLDDGTEVVIYPVMGSADWHGDEERTPEIEGVLLRRGRIVPVCDVAERLLGNREAAIRQAWPGGAVGSHG